MAITAGNWKTIEVAGHPCHVYEPPDPSEYGDTVLYLHGWYLSKLEDHPSVVRHFDRHGLRVIAPQTQRSWWVDRICPEFDPKISAEKYVVDRVVPFLESEWHVKPPRIALMGISMGGQGALRLAYKYPNTFPVVAAFFPSIDFQKRIEEGDPLLRAMYRDAEDARQDTATLHIHPLNWPRHQFFCCDPQDHRWHESAERLHMKLFSLGIPHEYDLETEAGGHNWKYVSRMSERAIDFIADALKSERLRVV